jgi:transcriptional antiterminator RfaH
MSGIEIGSRTQVGVGEGLALSHGERWFLVQALSKAERKAQWHLGAQGFRAYLPQIEKTVRHARKLRTVRAPLFPGYLFVVLDLSRDRWLSIRSTIGVARLFTTIDGRPVPVPSGIVEQLLVHTAGGLTRLDSGLSKGQRVRILTGPFAELIGTLERLDDAGRVQVLLEMMGSTVPVSLHRSALLPAA